jgi:hypothetical protein
MDGDFLEHHHRKSPCFNITIGTVGFFRRVHQKQSLPDVMHFVLHTELATTVVAQTNNQRDPLTCSTNAGILLGMVARDCHFMDYA